MQIPLPIDYSHNRTEMRSSQAILENLESVE